MLEVAVPGFFFALRVRHDVLKELDRLTVAIFWCAELNESLSALARVLALPERLVREEASRLEDLGFVAITSDGTRLAESGIASLERWRAVTTFNEAGHGLFFDTWQQEVHACWSKEPHAPVVEGLATSRHLRKRAMRQRNVLREMALQMGLSTKVADAATIELPEAHMTPGYRHARLSVPEPATECEQTEADIALRWRVTKVPVSDHRGSTRTLGISWVDARIFDDPVGEPPIAERFVDLPGRPAEDLQHAFRRALSNRRLRQCGPSEDTWAGVVLHPAQLVTHLSFHDDSEER